VELEIVVFLIGRRENANRHDQRRADDVTDRSRPTRGLSRDIKPQLFSPTRFLSSFLPLHPRAMSSTKRIQGKLFRGELGGDGGSDPSKTGSLTIDIPTNTLQTKSVQPLKTTKPAERVEADSDVPDGRYTIPYRDRLLRRIGNEYRGAERYRLEADRKKEVHWKRWGPYLSDRQWVRPPRFHIIRELLSRICFRIQATVREDYSHNGDAWNHFPHEHARSRAYRWGEDGIAGISDNHQRVCLALSLWNGEDRILKERLFGVTGHQGNHGEDVKELYWYLDSTPTHSYMKFLYKYPQRDFPYEQLVRESQTRGRDVPEFEILDTDAFDDNRYWDVFVEVGVLVSVSSCIFTCPQYAKDEEDASNTYARITAYNRGPDPATLHILPQFWFPNTWSWSEGKQPMPQMSTNGNCITAKHHSLGTYNLHCLPSPPPIDPRNPSDIDDSDSVEPELIFTENNTNFHRLYGGQNQTRYVKDAFHDHIIPSHRPEDSKTGIHLRRRTYDNSSDEEEQGPRTPFPYGPTFVNPAQKGTKSGAHYVFKDVPPNGGCAVVRLKLTPAIPSANDPTLDDEGLFDEVIEDRREEADEFYHSLTMGAVTDDFKQVMRQALGGMLWTKQHYQFIQREWLNGDPLQPPPPPERKYVRNKVSEVRSKKRLGVDNRRRTGHTCTSQTFFPCPISEF